MENQEFAHWAVIEVFGHSKYAGHVTTEQIGGASMLKLTVPEVVNEEVTLPGFVKFINHQSVFSITPVTEEYAVEMARMLSAHPIEGYQHKQVITQLAEHAVKEMKMNEVRKLLAQATGNGSDELDF